MKAYKRKFLYWPVLSLIVFGFMFYSKSMKSTHIDGPYISWSQEDRVDFTYVGFDTIQRLSQPVDPGTDQTVLHGLLGDSDVEYPLRKKYQPEASASFEAPRVLYLGNVYGDYDVLVDFLQLYGVVDAENHWGWQNAHLVFTGNVFGYGADVVKCLWLINRLEREATLTGGKVHLLIGDQEFKNLQGNIGTLNPRLYQRYNQAEIDYSTFYDTSTVQGKWLRSKDAVIRVNDNVVAHGGISPGIVEDQLSLTEINSLVREQLRGTGAEPDTTTHLVMGSDGPIRYSGYMDGGVENHQLLESTLDRVLNYYRASSMIVSTTGTKEVRSVAGGKLYAIDLATEKTDITLEGLLEEDDTFYRLTSEGEKINL